MSTKPSGRGTSLFGQDICLPDRRLLFSCDLTRIALALLVMGSLIDVRANAQAPTVPQTIDIQAWCGLPAVTQHNAHLVAPEPSGAGLVSTQSQFSGKDEAAVGVIMSLLGASDFDKLYAGSELDGKLWVKGKSVPLPIHYSTSGQAYRVETSLSQTTIISTFDGAAAVSTNNKGLVTPVATTTGSGRQALHLPDLLIAHALKNDKQSIRLFASSDNTFSIGILRQSETPTTEAAQRLPALKVYPSCILVDKDSRRIRQIDTVETAQNRVEHLHRLSTVYSDYRAINGVTLPTTQATYLDGALRHVFIVENATFGTSRPKQQFQQKGGSK